MWNKFFSKTGIAFLLMFTTIISCSKKEAVVQDESLFSYLNSNLENRPNSFSYRDVPLNPVVRLNFSSPVNTATAKDYVSLLLGNGGSIPVQISFENKDSTIVVQSPTPLQYLSKYKVVVNKDLQSRSGKKLNANIVIDLATIFNTADKFPLISDSALVELVQRQTFKYFWDFGHPVSGLARERNNSGDLVTSGGSGFGIMAIVTGIHRNFITRAQGLARMQTIVGFLKNNAQKFHGAFPHWLNGVNGSVIPFSAKDNGADLVETSFLMMGLLTARQYFNGSGADETLLRSQINEIWHGVEWDWFRRGGQNVLYWHWSPNFGWDMNMPIKGWHESLVTYVLAASSPTHSVPKIVYDNGWASNGGMRNGNIYLGHQLPLGPAFGGPLFFAHYSFLGINPVQLTDVYANYFTQNRNHTLINYQYCVNNPRNFTGYSDSCWGLTASDDINGYMAHSPTNDNGVISPTAALSSFPYTPNESMKALKFFYYKLGDKLWGPYGFYDAFSLHEPWFATSTLAIDQGPIVVMMENYRSGLLWNLFMSSPEIKSGMLGLGFASPHL
jgi:hypothetical protein